MVTSHDIESARRRYVDALGTDSERSARSELIRLVDEAIEQNRKVPRTCVAEGVCDE